MKLAMYVVDAFTREKFKGNPAAVILLESWLPDALMQSIASENNLSETAFIVRNYDNKFHIRWFSPLKEVAFCGHATLASAFILFTKKQTPSPLIFFAPAVGDLSVELLEHDLIEMRFPNLEPEVLTEIPAALIAGLSLKPDQVLRNRQAYFALYQDEQHIRAVDPDLERLKELAPYDVVITAPGDTHDFVSRYFWPANGGAEDQVTGSIHAGLAPLWARHFNKFTLLALQASQRSGLLTCRVTAEYVYVAGTCVAYLEGIIEV